ncbi:MAG TPA: amidase [Ilumatobacteraceae bacterium]|nr:amidase [Ilumatobacteraceae bacterium]
MDETAITSLGAADLSESIHRREVSCREVMNAYLDRIDARNPAVNAIVSVRDRDELIDEAANCDDELSRGASRGWMHGMPQAIKDVAFTKGVRTTMGSRLLAEFVPDFDCVMVERMKAAGCIVIGKTNVPEFGLGSHTFNDVFGTTFNAFDHSRTAGGSSGGAAVALAEHMLPVADGSDNMGSLRNPAAWNDIFGFRPSQGRVPGAPERDSFLAQLSTEGPMGRTVLDLALLLGTQAGYHPGSPLSLSGRLDELTSVGAARDALHLDPAGIRVAWLADLDGYLATEPGILDHCADGLRRLESLGCKVDAAAFDMPPDRVWEAWLVWRHVLVWASLSPLIANATKRELVKPEALWEIDRGLHVTGPQLSRASTERTLFYASITSLFDRFDALALPTTQVWPFDAAERWPQRVGDREMDTYHRWMEVTVYATFAGLPAISVPVGFDERGLPAGMQLIGRPRGDVELLRLAHAYESTLER